MTDDERRVERAALRAGLAKRRQEELAITAAALGLMQGRALQESLTALDDGRPDLDGRPLADRLAAVRRLLGEG